MSLFNESRDFVLACALLLLTVGGAGTTHAKGYSCKVAAYEFYWSGQFAGFIVNGRFSYNEAAVPASGIVREDDLLALDVSFYDPKGNHLRTYKDNQDKFDYPTVNFAFDTLTKELLQEGTWKVDDEERRYRNGFMMGEGSPDQRNQPGSQLGLAFWSRPSDEKTPHLHVDDWDLDNGDPPGDGEFGFPIGFSSHEDASFFYKTTQERANTGKIGKSYYDLENDVNELATDLAAYGPRVRVVRAKRSLKDLRDLRRCHAANRWRRH